MRKLLVAAVLTALTLPPAAARAGFVLDASVGQGYQTATPRDWEPLNLEIAPGYAPSLPVLSMFQLQLGIVTDFADTSGSKTNLELRPMLSIVPPFLPIYGRVIVGVSNLLGRDGKREIEYGGVVGLRVGIPGVAIIPAFGVFVEAGLIPRERDFVVASASGTTSESKLAWVVEGRAGAYLNF
ncbi:MAG: hypothetical protein ABSB49_11760 [Polyangia bacterium]|jgi:hypothetical protein